MFCRNCGRELIDGARFCTACGQAVEIPQAEPKAQNFSVNRPSEPEPMPAAQEPVSAEPEPVPSEDLSSAAAPEAAPAETQKFSEPAEAPNQTETNEKFQPAPQQAYQQAAPQQAYQEAAPQQAYQQAAPQQAYQQAAPQQAYQQAAPQQVYQQAPSQQAYQQAPPQQAYQQAAPQQTYQQAPPQQAYQQAPSQQAYQQAYPQQAYQQPAAHAYPMSPQAAKPKGKKKGKGKTVLIILLVILLLLGGSFAAIMLLPPLEGVKTALFGGGRKAVTEEMYYGSWTGVLNAKDEDEDFPEYDILLDIDETEAELTVEGESLTLEVKEGSSGLKLSGEWLDGGRFKAEFVIDPHTTENEYLIIDGKGSIKGDDGRLDIVMELERINDYADDDGDEDIDGQDDHDADEDSDNDDSDEDGTFVNPFKR